MKLTEPEYIITETELRWLQLGVDNFELYDSVRSRPYNEQAIRNKVLEEYAKLDNTRWTTRRVQEYLVEIRQQGEL